MNDLIRALDKVINNLDSLSDEEIQAKLKAHEGGLVGGAISNCRNFIRSLWKNEFSKYFIAFSGMYHEEFEFSNITISYSRKIDDVIIEAANDDYYPMAA